MALTSDATGDVYYRDANNFLTRLGVGNDGEVLTSTGTLPNWEALPSSGMSFNGSTANGIATYGGATTADVESLLTFAPPVLTVGASATAEVRILGHGSNDVKGLSIYSGGSFPTPEQYTLGLNWSGGTVEYDALNDFDHAFQIAGTTGLILTSAGKVGIGTTAPATKLDVYIGASNDDNLTLSSTGGYNPKLVFHDVSTDKSAGIEFDSGAQALRFFNNPLTTECMQVNASGIVLIGKTSSAWQTAGVEVGQHGQMQVTRSGGDVIQVIRTTDTGTAIALYYGTSAVGSIAVSAFGTAYNTSSDYRLKENIIDMTGAVDRVAQLQPRRFNFIVDADKTVDGFVAHEVSEFVPEAITGTKDAMRDAEKVVVDASGVKLEEDIEEVDWVAGKERTLVSEAVEAVDAVLYVEDDVMPEGKSIGDVKTPAIEAAEAVYADPIYASDTAWHETLSVPEYQGIDQAKLVPLLTAAIQELTARVEALEST
jgi:hypothetical protein